MPTRFCDRIHYGSALGSVRTLMIRPAAALVVCLSLFFAGCSTSPNLRKDSRDPLERVNRASYKLTDVVDRAVLKPVTKGYKFIAPQFVETGVSNFFANLGQPTVIVNDLLQAKFKDGMSDTGRFLLNTTLGIGGLFDPATSVGLDKHDEDFGQTLGKWGVPSGAYLFVPLYGPSTLRDATGSLLDVYSDPHHYVERDAIRYGLYGLNLIDTRARLLETDQTLESTFDRYAFVRNAYLQRREYQVTDGAVSPIEDEPLEDPEAETAPDHSSAEPK
jgi:phospholipid-binding lipoprotein MlaA